MMSEWIKLNHVRHPGPSPSMAAYVALGKKEEKTRVERGSIQDYICCAGMDDALARYVDAFALNMPYIYTFNGKYICQIVRIIIALLCREKGRTACSLW